VDWSGGCGNGINYDSCWISKVGAGGVAPLFKVLAFGEVPRLSWLLDRGR
jgi:hypothetical protein